MFVLKIFREKKIYYLIQILFSRLINILVKRKLETFSKKLILNKTPLLLSAIDQYLWVFAKYIVDPNKIANSEREYLTNKLSAFKTHFYLGLAIYKILINRGDLNFATEFRQKMLEVSKNQEINLFDKVFPVKIFRKINAYLEENNLSSANYYYKTITKGLKKNLYPSNLFENYTGIIQNKNLSFEAKDTSFKKVINNKKIALIGPGPYIHEAFYNLSEFDVIVFINHSLKINFEHNTKTTILYANGTVGNKILSQYSNQTLDYDWIIFKNSKQYKKFSKKEYNIKSKSIISYGLFTFTGDYNMAPISVLDLLTHSPKKIKIHNIDLYTSKEYYSSEFRLNPEIKNPQNRMKQFSLHHPNTQFNFFKNLSNHPKIYFDNHLNFLNDISEAQYMKLLQDNYSSELKERRSYETKTSS